MLPRQLPSPIAAKNAHAVFAAVEARQPERVFDDAGDVVVHGSGGTEDEDVVFAFMGGVFYVLCASATGMAAHVRQTNAYRLVGDNHDNDGQQEFQNKTAHFGMVGVIVFHRHLSTRV